MKYEALDRIHVIQTMMSQFLVYVSDNAEDEYHQGLSPEAKELVGKAMECLCDAYQKQGVYAFEEKQKEENSKLLRKELEKLNIQRPLKNEIDRLNNTISYYEGRTTEAEDEYNRLRTRLEYPIRTGGGQ